MSFSNRALSSLGKIAIVFAVAAAFIIGLAGTVILSLHTGSATVPDVVGKDISAGESALNDAGLSMRRRTTRPAPADVKPNTILSQTPHAGELVKVGQTVAVDISRAAQAGEIVTAPVEEPTPAPEAAQGNQNDNRNQNRRPRNRNANNSNPSGNLNSNAANSNRGNSNPPPANNRNATNLNANRAPNANSRNPTLNINRTTPTVPNLNRRTPAIQTPPFVRPSGNTRP